MAKPLTNSILIKLIKEEIESSRLGRGTITKSGLAKSEREKSKQIAKGDALQGVTGRERAILKDVEEILAYVAEMDDLYRYKARLEALLTRLLKKSKEIEAKAKAEKAEAEKAEAEKEKAEKEMAELEKQAEV